MFQNTNVVFLNTFNAILNIMDANACAAWIQYGHLKWNCVVNKRYNNKTYPNHKNINEILRW